MEKRSNEENEKRANKYGKGKRIKRERKKWTQEKKETKIKCGRKKQKKMNRENEQQKIANKEEIN